MQTHGSYAEGYSCLANLVFYISMDTLIFHNINNSKSNRNNNNVVWYQKDGMRDTTLDFPLDEWA